MAKTNRHLPSDLITVILGKLPTTELYKQAWFNKAQLVELMRNRCKYPFVLSRYYYPMIELRSVKRRSIYYYVWLSTLNVPVLKNPDFASTIMTLCRNADNPGFTQKDFDTVYPISLVYGKYTQVCKLIAQTGSLHLFKLLLNRPIKHGVYYPRLTREMVEYLVQNLNYTSAFWPSRYPPALLDYPDLQLQYKKAGKKYGQNVVVCINVMDILDNWASAVDVAVLWKCFPRKIVYKPFRFKHVLRLIEYYRFDPEILDVIYTTRPKKFIGDLLESWIAEQDKFLELVEMLAFINGLSNDKMTRYILRYIGYCDIAIVGRAYVFCRQLGLVSESYSPINIIKNTRWYRSYLFGKAKAVPAY